MVGPSGKKCEGSETNTQDNEMRITSTFDDAFTVFQTYHYLFKQTAINLFFINFFL